MVLWHSSDSLAYLDTPYTPRYKPLFDLSTSQ